MSDFILRASNGLRDLKRRDPQYEVFGAGSHAYEMAPALTEAEVLSFETRHKITLPEDYRSFLLHIGNGGAGPYYGIFPLGMMDGLGSSIQSWETMVRSLAVPFPCLELWNWSREQLEALHRESEALDGEDGPLLEQYWSETDGAFPICHMGCALRIWLVVTGPETGNVWEDLRPDMEGWRPITFANGKHMSFADWYLHWLEAEPLNPQANQASLSSTARNNAR